MPKSAKKAQQAAAEAERVRLELEALRKRMRAETEDILRKYESMFKKYGLSKDDIINSNCYVTDMSIVDEYGDPWCAWSGDKTAPAGVCVKAGLEGDRTVMIQLTVAQKR